MEGLLRKWWGKWNLQDERDLAGLGDEGGHPGQRKQPVQNCQAQSSRQPAAGRVTGGWEGRSLGRQPRSGRIWNAMLRILADSRDRLMRRWEAQVLATDCLSSNPGSTMSSLCGASCLISLCLHTLICKMGVIVSSISAGLSWELINCFETDLVHKSSMNVSH